MFIILICGDGFVGIYMLSKLIQLYFLIRSLLYIKHTSLKLFKKKKERKRNKTVSAPERLTILHNCMDACSLLGGSHKCRERGETTLKEHTGRQPHSEGRGGLHQGPGLTGWRIW